MGPIESHENDYRQNNVKMHQQSFAPLLALGAVVSVALVGAGVFVNLRYKVSKPSQYVVRTGWLIKDVQISKNALQLPFQTIKTFSIEPNIYSIKFNSMSKERIPFKLPSVWTIGPDISPESLKNGSLEKFVKTIMEKTEEERHILIDGIIQGEMRLEVANMAHDEIFNGREKFQTDVKPSIAKLLDPYGLFVYSVNIEELADLDKENSYFEEQKKRALQEVNQKARVNVAQSIRDGEIGEKVQLGETRKNIANIESEVTIVENERRKEIAESKMILQIAEANFSKETNIALAESKAAAENRALELQHAVETSRGKQEVERLRAKDYSIANLAAEIAIRKADGEAQSKRLSADATLYSMQKEAEAALYNKQKAADATLYNMQKEADGKIAFSDAALYNKQKESDANLYNMQKEADGKIALADATLYTMQKEAEGNLALAEAQAIGLRRLIESAGSVESLVQYELINKNVLPQLAAEQAKAVLGMQPNISIWNTGNNDSTASSALTDLFKTGMPLFDGIKQQTGIDFLKSVGVQKNDRE